MKTIARRRYHKLAEFAFVYNTWCTMVLFVCCISNCKESSDWFFIYIDRYLLYVKSIFYLHIENVQNSVGLLLYILCGYYQAYYVHVVFENTFDTDTSRRKVFDRHIIYKYYCARITLRLFMFIFYPFFLFFLFFFCFIVLCLLFLIYVCF